jgi:DNA modification methylase
MEFELSEIPQHLRKYFTPKHKQWIVRNDIIWAKRNGMPESVTDRFSKKHEYFFFMVKSKKYYFDLDAIRDKHKQVSIERAMRGVSGTNIWVDGPDGQTPHGLSQPRQNITTKIPKEQAEMFGSPRARQHRNIKGNMTDSGLPRTTAGLSLKTAEERLGPKGKNPGSVSDFWDIPTKPSSAKHYASYNDSLLVKPILAGCPKDGIIYDPFMGTGSTAEAAIRAGRRFIGSEMSEDYVKIAEERLDPFLRQLQLF